MWLRRLKRPQPDVPRLHHLIQRELVTPSIPLGPLTSPILTPQVPSSHQSIIDGVKAERRPKRLPPRFIQGRCGAQPTVRACNRRDCFDARQPTADAPHPGLTRWCKHGADRQSHQCSPRVNALRRQPSRSLPGPRLPRRCGIASGQPMPGDGRYRRGCFAECQGSQNLSG